MIAFFRFLTPSIDFDFLNIITISLLFDSYLFFFRFEESLDFRSFFFFENICDCLLLCIDFTKIAYQNTPFRFVYFVQYLLFPLIIYN
jgi:hypothetical protein